MQQRVSPWCPDCGHERHAARKCTYRMPMSKVVQLMARGQLLRTAVDIPRCDCEEKRRLPGLAQLPRKSHNSLTSGEVNRRVKPPEGSVVKRSSKPVARRARISEFTKAEIRLGHLVDSAIVGLVGGLFYDIVKVMVLDHVAPVLLSLAGVK